MLCDLLRGLQSIHKIDEDQALLGETRGDASNGRLFE